MYNAYYLTGIKSFNLEFNIIYPDTYADYTYITLVSLEWIIQSTQELWWCSLIRKNDYQCNSLCLISEILNIIYLKKNALISFHVIYRIVL